jgi:hypothetical protein
LCSSVHNCVATHHEVCFHDLRKTFLDLDGWKVEVKAEDDVENPKTCIVVEISAFPTPNVSYITIIVKLRCTFSVGFHGEIEDAKHMNQNEVEPLEVEL